MSQTSRSNVANSKHAGMFPALNRRVLAATGFQHSRAPECDGNVTTDPANAAKTGT
jgi:hypothetical protein